MNSTEFVQPAEWEKHKACWLAWPAAEELWEKNLGPAQREFSELCRSISEFGDPLKILLKDKSQEKALTENLGSVPFKSFEIPYGDIWLRDTAPIFLRKKNGKVLASVFQFNGWGEKYILEFDNRVAESVASASRQEIIRHPWVLEGGSIESDGEGTILTSKQCLLNPNRNPSLSQDDIEALLSFDLGAKKVLWVTDGLLNDHTDGHIDTIVRFVAPGEVVCMSPAGNSDPNAEIMNRIGDELSEMMDAKDRRLKVHRIPSPGEVKDRSGEIMPASYLNFYIANNGVVVPTYGVANDEAAVLAIQKLFPTRKVVGLSAYAILSGGGAFHCITQQEVTEAI